MGVGGGGKILRKKRYEGVIFNVISVTRGWVGVQFPEKKRYVTLEWPLTHRTSIPSGALPTAAAVSPLPAQLCGTNCRPQSKNANPSRPSSPH